MTRNRASAKQAGARFERAMADYLAATVDDRIDRRVKTGAKDRGDIGGLRTIGGGRVVIEAKDYGGRLLPGPWLKEAEIERGNDDAVAGIVIAKRRGTSDPGEQFVLMSAADFVALMTGARPIIDRETSRKPPQKGTSVWENRNSPRGAGNTGEGLTTESLDRSE